MLTVKELASNLNISPKTVYQWAKEGYIPSYKLGDCWRFNEDEVNRWLADRKQKCTDTDAIARQILAPYRQDMDLAGIVEKAIASETQKSYTGRSGKPDLNKGLKKGGQHEFN